MFDIIANIDRRSGLSAFAVLSFLLAGLAHGQSPAGAAGSSAAPDAEWTALSGDRLEELVGPIALYPDELIAIVLPASTYPLQIVQAARYLEAREANPELEPDAAWDDSVVALLNYPEALELLNEDLDWTYELGEAVVYQQGDVLNAVQSFRDRAYAAGNLASDDRQVVAAEDDGAITISPADEKVVYVPYYDPATVVIRQPVPVYHYYPDPYPLYYYPYPVGYSFGPSLFWGVTTAFLISWHDHYLHVHHHSHFGHPYYGYSYYTPWYPRTGFYVNVNLVDHRYHWRPSYRHGGRPRHPAGYARLRDDTVIRAPRQRHVGSARIGNRRDEAGVRERLRRPAAGSARNPRSAARVYTQRGAGGDTRLRTRSETGGHRDARGSLGNPRARADVNGWRARSARPGPGRSTRNERTAAQPPRLSTRSAARNRAHGADRAERAVIARAGRIETARRQARTERSPQPRASARRAQPRGATPTFGRVAPARSAPPTARARTAHERPANAPTARRPRAGHSPTAARPPSRAASPRVAPGSRGHAQRAEARPGHARSNRRAR